MLQGARESQAVRVASATGQKEVAQGLHINGNHVLRFLRSPGEAADRDAPAGQVAS